MNKDNLYHRNSQLLPKSLVKLMIGIVIVLGVAELVLAITSVAQV